MFSLSALFLVATAAQAAETQNVGAWKVEVEANRVFLSQPAGSASPGSRPELVLRCSVWEDKSQIIGRHHHDKEAYFFYAPGFASGERELVATFDGDPPKKYWGGLSTDRKSLFFKEGFGETADGFIRSLRAHSKLSIVVKSKEKDPPPEYSFDLAGINEALTPWLKLCPMKNK